MGEMEIAYYLSYHGLEPLDTFLDRVDQEVIEGQRVSYLSIGLMETPARWWRMYCNTLKDWPSIKQTMKERFS